MDKERTSVVFYRSWYEMVNEFEASSRLALFDAILAYAFEGEMPGDEFIKLGIYQICDQLDRDHDRYEKRREYWKNGRRSSAKADSGKGADGKEEAPAAEAVPAGAAQAEAAAPAAPAAEQGKTRHPRSRRIPTVPDTPPGDGGLSIAEISMSVPAAPEVTEPPATPDHVADSGKQAEQTGPPKKGRTPKPLPFEVPTVKQVEIYAAGLGRSVDAGRFITFHKANGWYVGRRRARSWEAALQSWIARGDEMARESKQQAITKTNKSYGNKQSNYTGRAGVSKLPESFDCYEDTL